MQSNVSFVLNVVECLKSHFEKGIQVLLPINWLEVKMTQNTSTEHAEHDLQMTFTLWQRG